MKLKDTMGLVSPRWTCCMAFAVMMTLGVAASGQSTTAPVAPAAAPATPAVPATSDEPQRKVLPETMTPQEVPAPGHDEGAQTTQQVEPDGQDNNGFTLNIVTNEVNQIFTVIDKHGHFVTGLKQQNFGLLDDGRPPEKVLHFTQETNLPLRIGIMLDTSSSIRQRFQFEQQAATDFLLQVLHQSDFAFIEGFDVQTEITQNYTNRIDLLDTGIRKLRPAGGTSLFDSLYKTCRDQMLTLHGAGNVRKVLVLVSDGDDNYSRVLESESIKMCQRAETLVYTISTNVGPSKDKGDDVLQQIADATGGHAFYPQRIEDVAQGFHNIEEELRSQYSLVYRPADFKQDGSFRTIYLRCLLPGDTVRTRKGYFAPKAAK